MSYREENGQVVLTMSREEWNSLLIGLGMLTGVLVKEGWREKANGLLELLTRLNEGNPNYTPYEVTERPNADTLCNCGRKYYEHRESGYKHAAVKLDHAFQAKA